MKSRQKTTTAVGLLIVLIVVCAAFAASLKPAHIVLAETPTDNIVWSEDFEGDVSGYENYFTIENGVARPKLDAGGNMPFMYTLPEEKKLASNNYEVSFDLKLDALTGKKFVLYVHFLGLTSGENAYFSIEEDGTWGAISSTAGANMTSGPGAPTGYKDGSVMNEAVNLLEFVHIRMVHYEGILELWANDMRWCVSSLSALGNDKWSARKSFTEQPVNGFTFHFHMKNGDPSLSAAIDNIVIKEALPASKTGYSESVDVEQSQSKVFGNEISGNLLGQSAYTVSASYSVADMAADAPEEEIAIELAGLNALVGKNVGTGDHYSVDFVAKLNSDGIIPEIRWMDLGEVKKITGDKVLPSGDIIDLAVEIGGDNMNFYIDGQSVLLKSFRDDLAMNKGPLQVVSIVNSASAVWTEMEYSFDGPVVERVELSSDSTTATVGQIVTFTASVEPDSVEYKTVKWYVNDQEVFGQIDLVYEFTATESGTFKVKCEIDGVPSSNRFIVVKKTETSGGDDGEVTPPPKDNNKKDGCKSALNGASTAIIAGVAMVIAGVALFARNRKRNHQ